MNRSSFLTVVGLAALGGTIALAQPAKESKPGMQPPAKQGAQPDKAPPGVSEADMKACMEAATPGPQHEALTKMAGTWSGKSKMWMGPDSEPMTSDCTSTITAIMDGRFTKCENTGDMPGMGAFTGLGLYGYDNVARKYQSTWIDNFGTAMMTGTGDLSPDGKTLTWNYTYTCPIAKKPVTMREVERRTGDNAMTLEMFGPDPHTGKEFKMMEISLTRTGGGAAPTKASSSAR